MSTFQQVAVCAILALVTCPTAAQHAESSGHETPAAQTPNHDDHADENAEYQLVTRVYDVSDLLVGPVPYPALHESDLSETPRRAFPNATIPRGPFGGMAPGGMGGGMGGFGGQSAQGGGFFQVSDGVSAAPHLTVVTSPGSQITFDRLIGTITSTIAPDTWDEIGGPGTISALGETLVISQTTPIHDEIASLLAAVRGNLATRQTLLLQAFWLWQTDQQLATWERASRANAPRGSVAWDKWRTTFQTPAPEGLHHYRAALQCFSGQTVHVQTGGQRLQVTGMTPVVGGDVAAYAPQVSLLQDGAVLQLTAAYLPDRELVTLDLHSRVTVLQGNDPEAQVPTLTREGDAPLPSATAIDRPVIQVQRLSTTTRLAINQVTLVGGMSFAEDIDAQHLYLYVLATLPE